MPSAGEEFANAYREGVAGRQTAQGESLATNLTGAFHLLTQFASDVYLTKSVDDVPCRKGLLGNRCARIVRLARAFSGVSAHLQHFLLVETFRISTMVSGTFSSASPTFTLPRQYPLHEAVECRDP
jgi:hypothetical protein